MNLQCEFLTIEEVGKILGVKRSSSQQRIKKLNQELIDDGYCVVSGKVNKKYFDKRYGLNSNELLFPGKKVKEKVNA
ncbi:ICEBs1 excisionase [Brochothrix thermosphacta]|uniref:ICEBs1 excisionase n=1 Tax=Brochothrix thermosphacta TaxID=2756 RepID=A0A2X0QEQ4_BROTH|nr:ICEBs1 excisionase [Brochothrix thermosphacta]SPP27224.1 conserved hypothetical protein [Brochothrix thermosphacta]SPP28893.1 conserved hypothetical protein [Brochothrix thermosphacta]